VLGTPTHPFINRSRAGLISTDSPSQLLCLDIDGLPIVEDRSVELGRLLDTIGLGGVSYVVQWSSSQGLNGDDSKLNAHVFVVVDEPVTPEQRAAWVKYVHLRHLPELLRLARANVSLKWTLDPRTCLSTQPIFLAPPVLEDGVTTSVTERVQLVRRGVDLLPVSRLAVPKEFNVDREEEAKINELRAAAGLSPRKFGQKADVPYVENPTPTTFTPVNTSAGCVHGNLGDGDSCAYWHPVENPTYIYSFKGDGPYRTEDIDPEYCEQAWKRALDAMTEAAKAAGKAEASAADGEQAPEAASEALFDLQAASFGRFLDSVPAPRRWLLKGFLPLGKSAALVAPGGTGKSQLVFQLAISVATGVPLANHWEVDETGSVLYLAAEDDEDELHRRGRIIHSPLSQVHDLSAVRSRLYVRSMVSMDNLMTKTDRASGEVERTDFAARVIETVRTVPDLKLVILDPVSRFRGGDENAAQDGTRFVEAVESIVEATGATVLLVHHTNKGSANQEEQTQHASRGSSALTDGVRWQANLAPLSGSEAKKYGLDDDARRRYLSFTPTKNNYAPPSGKVYLERLEGGYLSVCELKASSKETNELDMKTKIRTFLQSEARAGKTYTQNSLAEKWAGEDKAPLHLGDNPLRRLVKELVAAGGLTLGSGRVLVVTAYQSNEGEIV
jgi:RecA-family ATPase